MNFKIQYMTGKYSKVVEGALVVTGRNVVQSKAVVVVTSGTGGTVGHELSGNGPLKI